MTLRALVGFKGSLSGGSIAPVVSVAWLASLNAYSKIREHMREIAEAISEAK